MQLKVALLNVSDTSKRLQAIGFFLFDEDFTRFGETELPSSKMNCHLCLQVHMIHGP